MTTTAPRASGIAADTSGPPDRAPSLPGRPDGDRVAGEVSVPFVLPSRSAGDRA